MTTTSQSNSGFNERDCATPATLDAVRLEMRNAKMTRDADKARDILAAIMLDWRKNGYLHNANMYTKDGNDDAIVAVVRNKLRALGWAEDTHYTTTRMSDDRGYTITFRAEYTSFKP